MKSHTFMAVADFALNLECLEAQFYVCATTGQPLPANLTGNDLLPIGCQQANFTDPDLVLIAAEIAQVHIHWQQEPCYALLPHASNPEERLGFRVLGVRFRV